MIKRNIQKFQRDEETTQLYYERYLIIYYSTQVSGERSSPRQKMQHFLHTLIAVVRRNTLPLLVI